jgi:hypothetical protein
MTPEQRLDRLERIARLMSEGALRSLRESRKQTSKLKDYFAALSAHDAAKLAAAERPEDFETSEKLRRATESLNQAREELKQAIESGRNRPQSKNPN